MADLRRQELKLWVNKKAPNGAFLLLLGCCRLYADWLGSDHGYDAQ